MPKEAANCKILCFTGDIFCSFSCIVAKFIVPLRRVKELTAAKFTKKWRHNSKKNMNNELKNEPQATAAVKSVRQLELLRYIERQIRRHESIIKDCMEDLTSNFNENFAWKSEVIYKSNLKLTTLRSLYDTISAEECDEEYTKFILRHTAEHAADDIMHRNPYCSSSNGAVNLAHRWEFESAKGIHHLALNLLDRLEPDAD